MIPQLATVSGLSVGTNVPLRDPEPGVSQLRDVSTASSLMEGVVGRGVLGFEWGGLEFELSLEVE